jgi:hypothetical protein
MIRALLAAVALTAASLLWVAQPAWAGCTTKYYFNQVHNGMTVKQVANKLSNWGGVIQDLWGIAGHYQIREYPTCSGQPDNPRPEVGFHGSPLHVDSKKW